MVDGSLTRDDPTSRNQDYQSDSSELSDILTDEALEELERATHNASTRGSADMKPTIESKCRQGQGRYPVSERQAKQLGGGLYEGPPPMRKAAQRAARRVARC